MCPPSLFLAQGSGSVDEDSRGTKRVRTYSGEEQQLDDRRKGRDYRAGGDDDWDGGRQYDGRGPHPGRFDDRRPPPGRFRGRGRGGGGGGRGGYGRGRY